MSKDFPVELNIFYIIIITLIVLFFSISVSFINGFIFYVAIEPLFEPRDGYGSLIVGLWSLIVATPTLIISTVIFFIGRKRMTI